MDKHQNSLSGNILLCAAFIIFTALCAQIEIPLPYVPISGQTFAVGLAATVLGSRWGTFAIACYVGLGALGAPVFTGFDGGFDVITGPTGGYIFGFIAAAFVIGFILEKTTFTVINAIIANITGMVIILFFGVIILKLNAGLGWPEALAAGVYPFIITGVIKAVLAGLGGIALREKIL